MTLLAFLGLIWSVTPSQPPPNVRASLAMQSMVVDEGELDLVRIV